MTTVNVESPSGDLARTVDLPSEIFDVQVNVPLIHQVVVGQLAAARQGTHATKTRGEVAGGGRKPYRQKGTGRARQGSIRAPQFTGGGTVHGPTPRNYEQRTPKKMKAAALRGALSDRARGGRLHVVTGLVDGDVPSTKVAAANLARITERRHVLVVAEREDALTWKSLRNLPSVHLIAPDQLNTYDVLVSDDVVFTEGAYERFVAGPAARTSARAEAAATGKGSTRPAGAGVSDAKAEQEVLQQTDSDLLAAPDEAAEAAGAADAEAAAAEPVDEGEGK